MSDQFVLNYESRSDGGPRLVGPFDSRDDAWAHAKRIAEAAIEQHGSFSACSNVAPLHAPEVSP